MIVKIARGQPELILTAVAPGPEGGRLATTDGVRLVITAPAVPPGRSLSPIVRTGSWGYPLPIRPYPPEPNNAPAIIYPAFTLTDEGSVVFRLDRLLWSRPAGRYIGTVSYRDTLLFTLDIDLEPMAWVPVKIEVR